MTPAPVIVDMFCGSGRSNNEEGFIKEFCYIMLVIAALGIGWLFFIGFPALGEKAADIGVEPITTWSDIPQIEEPQQTPDPFTETAGTTWYYCNAANMSECWKNASEIPLYSAKATMYRAIV